MGLKEAIKIIFTVFFAGSFAAASGQCCAGASPIAGGANVTLLGRGQMEVSSRYQYTYGNKTFRGDTLNNINLFTKVYSHYAFLNIGYGLSENLSFYAACGYYPEKTEMLILDTISGKGISELILLPRYKVLGTKREKSKTELVVGMGMKIPLGSYNQDRVIWVNPTTGEEFRVINSPATQPSTGSNDFIFNLQFLQMLPKQKFYAFANMSYIRRGVNPLGQDFGDIASASVMAGKNIFKWMGVAAEIKAEKTDSLVDPKWPSTQKNTGYKKISATPSINLMPFKNLTFIASFEYPLYQYMNGVQMGTRFIAVASLNYRFNIVPGKAQTAIQPESVPIVPITPN